MTARVSATGLHGLAARAALGHAVRFHRRDEREHETFVDDAPGAFEYEVSFTIEP
jgi:hypothetical protein